MSYLVLTLILLPFWHFHHAPAIYRALCDTTAGSFVLEIHRDWSPHGAERFYQLVNAGYYNDSRFFRVVSGRWVQFGISGDPAVAERWRHNTIPDDRLKQHNTPGFAGFSNTGPHTRSTQIYINTGDNSRVNDRESGFAPFAEVVDGMDVVTRLYSGYGENSGGGMRAGHQDQMFRGGNAYLDQQFPKLDKLLRISIAPTK
jgi:cyclophilin family peptidyl-prolyl cis-trans isomerase